MRTAKTPLPSFKRPAMMDVDSAESTPQPTVRGSSGSAAGYSFRAGSQTCIKPRQPVMPQEPLTVLKKRPSVGGSDAFKVYVRVKPVMKHDLTHGLHKEAVAVCEKEGKLGLTVPCSNGKENWFSDFDGVLEKVTNQQVFDSMSGGLMPALLSGINASIMAYGQTGSGKTYTVFGCNEPNNQMQGLLHLTLYSIADAVCIGSPQAQLSVGVFEVYNEELFSLLDASGPARKALDRGMPDFYVHKAKLVSNVDETVGLVMAALEHRAQDSTARNQTSSRSHAFVKLQLVQPNGGSEGKGLSSTLYLVDLAGSESISHASSNEQQRETVHINKSLSALGRVVSNLSDGSNHIPYRDSMLTKVLREGLDPGSARVALVTTVSTFQSDVAVTKDTLKFAQRARNVRTFAQVNAAPKRLAPLCPEDMQRQLQELQAINNELVQQLADLVSSSEHQRSERQMEGMKQQLDEFGKVRDKLQLAAGNSARALEEERAAHAATREREMDLKGSNGELREAMAAAEAEAQRAMEAALVEAKRTVAAAEANAQQAVAAAEANTQRAVAALAELRGQASAAAMAEAQLNGELAGARALAEQREAQHRALQDQLVQSKEQLTSLKGQLAMAESDLQLQLEQLRADAIHACSAAAASGEEASGLQERLRGMQQRLEQAERYASQQARQLAEAEEQAAGQAKRLAQLEEQAAGQSTRLAEAEEQAAGQAKRLAEVEEQVAGLSQRLAEAAQGASEQVTALHARVAELELQVSELQVQLAAAEERATALQERLTRGQEQVVTLQQQLLEEEEREQGLRRELESSQVCVGQQVARAQQLEADVATVRAQAGGEVQRLAAALAAAQAVATGLQQQVKEVQAESEAHRQAGSALQSELVAARSQVDALTVQAEEDGFLQGECERLRQAGSDATEQARRAAAECERLREAATRTEKEAAERLAKLEAQMQRDVAPRRNDNKANNERMRQLEADYQKAEGTLLLKDKLIHQLEKMCSQLEAQVANGGGRQDTNGAQLSDQQGGGGSPYTGPARSDMPSASPAADEGAPVSNHNGRTPTNGGMLLLGRTTTSSAAALARGTKANRPDFSSPPQPKPAGGGSLMRAACGAAAAAAAGTEPIDLTTPPHPKAAKPQVPTELEVTDLTTPVGTPLPPAGGPAPAEAEARTATPDSGSFDEDDDTLLREMREQRRLDALGLKTHTRAVRNKAVR